MTGSAITEAEEFDKIYKLSVLAIPDQFGIYRISTESGLEEVDGKDEMAINSLLLQPR
jgi:preprotein translocase subunit SecA